MSNGKAYNDADEQLSKGACGQETEVYSRVTGYYRPVNRWNKDKQEEFRERKTFEVKPLVTLKKIDSGIDYQHGIEYNTYDIVTGGAE